MIGTESIRSGFDANCLQQALNCRMAPGVTEVVLNPDAHSGYGAPIGCVMVSPTHIYPGPVGVDIKCIMRLLQLDLPEEHIIDRKIRRALLANNRMRNFESKMQQLGSYGGPIDESPDAYKDFAEVLKSVEQAGLARPVATLKARFVIKDNDKADD